VTSARSGRAAQPDFRGSPSPEVDVPQSQVLSDPAASPFDVSRPLLVRSWKDCGSDVAWVEVAGELDITTAPALEQTLHDAELRARLVVLDLRKLSFTDSCGVRVISLANVRASRGGRRLVLVRGPSQMSLTFTLAASDVLEFVDLNPGEPVVQALLQLPQGPGSIKRCPGACPTLNQGSTIPHATRTKRAGALAPR
jgi:anti-anti-sigma factor